MNRATPMAPEERRQHIIDATVPLLIEFGPEVPTRAIAQAAGIAEGTVFRAFDTKEELIHLALHAALRPDQAIATLEQLGASQSLNERAAAILDTLQAEIARTHSLFAHFPKWRKGRPGAGKTQGGTRETAKHDDTAGGSTHSNPIDAGVPSARERAPQRRPGPPPHMRENHKRMNEAVCRALRPFHSELRVTVELAAHILTALAFSSRFSESEGGDDPAELAGIILHGIAAPEAAAFPAPDGETSTATPHLTGGPA